MKKTVVVTGGTSGLGLSTVKQLAQIGANVIFTGRDEVKCKVLESELRSLYPNSSIHCIVAELSTMENVRNAASQIIAILNNNYNACLDVLINNAGTVSSWRINTAEGYELQFAVNHLASFLLTSELYPYLNNSIEGRILTISSGSHYHTKIKWDDIMLLKRYNCLKAYKQSKLANVIFSAEFNRKYNKTSSIRAYAIDPGLVKTDIGLKGTAGLVRFIWKLRQRQKDAILPDEAAKSIVQMTMGDIDVSLNSIYWKQCKPLMPSKVALDPQQGKSLWELSERLCGLKKFNIKRK